MISAEISALRLRWMQLNMITNYARSVQQAYGNVVSNTLSILRCWGMDEKAKYIRESTEKKAKNVPVKGEFQALKKDGEFE